MTKKPMYCFFLLFIAAFSLNGCMKHDNKTYLSDEFKVYSVRGTIQFEVDGKSYTFQNSGTNVTTMYRMEDAATKERTIEVKVTDTLQRTDVFKVVFPESELSNAKPNFKFMHFIPKRASNDTSFTIVKTLATQPAVSKVVRYNLQKGQLRMEFEAEVDKTYLSATGPNLKTVKGKIDVLDKIRTWED
ncbi:hypothetical protein LX64_04837 [Chitinophaga skermanii]|uniref:Uncharacterized protein n=2 Tax=Chitinophaga skermanii TaxID=331697 RepID=A0A327Q1Y2_9BACT|nr:hypothetical protein LX64_04837 [Chitinophaga skermanii]